MPRRFVDISVALEAGIASDAPGFEPGIEYLDHRRTAADVCRFFPGLTPAHLPGGEGLGDLAPGRDHAQRHARTSTPPTISTRRSPRRGRGPPHRQHAPRCGRQPPQILRTRPTRCCLGFAKHGEREATQALPADCPYSFDQIVSHDWYPANRHGIVDDIADA